MNLKGIRKKVVELSGRYDLVQEDWQDNGMNFYIQQAQRDMDRRTEFKKGEARLFQTVTLGQVYAKIQDCRAVKEVWLSGTEGRVQLVKAEIAGLRNIYDYPYSEIDPDEAVLYYAIGNLRVSPETDRMTAPELAALAAQTGIEDVLITADPMHYTYTGIFFLPAISSGYTTMEVWGKFYSPLLTEDADESYWTVEHPQTLIHGTMLRLAMSNRNRQEMQDWNDALKIDLNEIENDFIEEEVEEIREMRI